MVWQLKFVVPLWAFIMNWHHMRKENLSSANGAGMEKCDQEGSVGNWHWGAGERQKLGDLAQQFPADFCCHCSCCVLTHRAQHCEINAVSILTVSRNKWNFEHFQILLKENEFLIYLLQMENANHHWPGETPSILYSLAYISEISVLCQCPCHWQNTY